MKVEVSMRVGIDHVALSVNEFDWYVDFFQTVFYMEIEKKAGEYPNRKIWFDQGIQLNESIKQGVAGELYHHIAIRVANPKMTYEKLDKIACKKSNKSDNWYIIKDVLLIEILNCKGAE